MSNEFLQPNPLPESGQPQRTNPLLWGALLVVAGGLILMQNLGLFEGIARFIWPLAFAAGGLAFGSVYVSNPREHWWAVIPAFALFGLSGTIMISEFGPQRLSFLAGSAFLGALGLAFWVIYFTRRDYWWAMIPGGTLLSLSAVAAVSGIHSLSTVVDPGSVLFLGIGATFLLVALSSVDEGHSRWWAYIPAGVMLLLGFVVFSQRMAMFTMMNWFWPVVLMGAGLLLLLRALGNKRG